MTVHRHSGDFLLEFSCVVELRSRLSKVVPSQKESESWTWKRVKREKRENFLLTLGRILYKWLFCFCSGTHFLVNKQLLRESPRTSFPLFLSLFLPSFVPLSLSSSPLELDQFICDYYKHRISDTTRLDHLEVWFHIQTRVMDVTEGVSGASVWRPWCRTPSAVGLKWFIKLW